MTRATTTNNPRLVRKDYEVITRNEMKVNSNHRNHSSSTNSKVRSIPATRNKERQREEIIKRENMNFLKERNSMRQRYSSPYRFINYETYEESPLLSKQIIVFNNGTEKKEKETGLVLAPQQPYSQFRMDHLSVNNDNKRRNSQSQRSTVSSTREKNRTEMREHTHPQAHSHSRASTPETRQSLYTKRSVSSSSAKKKSIQDVNRHVKPYPEIDPNKDPEMDDLSHDMNIFMNISDIREEERDVVTTRSSASKVRSKGNQRAVILTRTGSSSARDKREKQKTHGGSSRDKTPSRDMTDRTLVPSRTTTATITTTTSASKKSSQRSRSRSSSSYRQRKKMAILQILIILIIRNIMGSNK